MEAPAHPSHHVPPPADPQPAGQTLASSSSGKHSRFPVPWVVGIIIVAGLYFGTQLAASIMLTVIPILSGIPQSRVENWLDGAASAQFVYVLLVEVMTLAILAFIMKGWGITFRMLGLVRARIRDFFYALLAYPPYFIINAAAAIAASALLHVNLNQRQQTGFETAISPTDLAMTFVSLVILPPIVEEIVMRGFLFSSMKRNFKPVMAAVITSVVFAIAHLQFTGDAPLLWAAAIDTFLLSLVLCYLRHKTGSLWPGIFLHGIKNFLAFLVLFVFKIPV
jgi:membrane protease YdiL (CAAX protease family)